MSTEWNSNLPRWSGCWASSVQYHSRFGLDCSLHSLWSCPHRNLPVCPCVSGLTPLSSDRVPFYSCNVQREQGGSMSQSCWKSIGNDTHGSNSDPVKQCAAVRTQRGETSEPPHTWCPPCCRLTCQGQSSITASVPPTIRSWEPTCPQSDKWFFFINFKDHFLYSDHFQVLFRIC